MKPTPGEAQHGQTSEPEAAPALTAADAAVAQAQLLAQSITQSALFEAKRIISAGVESAERRGSLVSEAETLTDDAVAELPPVAASAASVAARIHKATDERVRQILADAETEGLRIKSTAESQTQVLVSRAERRVNRLERRHRLFRRRLRAQFVKRRILAMAGMAAAGSAIAAFVVLSPDFSHTESPGGALPAAVAASESAPPVVCPVPSRFRATFVNAARSADVPVGLLGAVAEAESRFDPGAKSGAGAQGMLQLMPVTARMLQVNPLNTRQNIRGGARYLRYLRNQFGSYDAALAAYHAGPTAQSRLSYGPATQRYVEGILGRRAAFESCG